MDAAAVSRPKPVCFGAPARALLRARSDDGGRPTAAARLEALLGRELALRLVRALSAAR